MSAPGRVCARAAAALLLCALAACGSAGAKDAGPPTLTWYVGPDRVGAGALAQACTTAAGGAYKIQLEQMPADVDARHAMLVRRLTAKDTSIDLLSLDSAFTAEFSAARFLAPVPEELAPEFGKDVLPAALTAATYDGQLAVAPWWFDPQLLWFRGNVAERAGLDTSKPISWEDLVAGAERLDVTIQINDRDGSGLAEWVNALIVGGDGDLVRGTGRDPKVGLDSEAGRAAASVASLYLDSGRGPGPSREALASFAAPGGGFLIASSSIITDPALAAVAVDMGWTAYPVVGETSVAPLSGVGLAVPLYAPRTEMSYAAINCLTSPTSLRTLMVDTGHSASRLTAYDIPGVADSYPMAEVTKAAVQTGAAVPVTPYWHAAQSAINDTWRPLADFVPESTLDESQRAVRAAIAGELP
ncbi:extracellular solute-binding protein [Aeromicrobium sp. A1-2]|uniref:extracellular solute-binding protein n=1 Tax=Aeromicrobium sp. A1-2 TaxID=2107713 RepID=UPI0013C3703C|nr:extracellular solute-binding protein [Aeromicrobium sp. A1-2]